jgi:cytoskeletal protein CcmA (bactofilin family)
MFTKKPESGESVTKLGEGPGDSKTPFTERPPKTPRLSANKMVPSIIGEDLTITGNVTSKGEIQVDGEIQGDIHCASLLLGDKAQVKGGVVAEDIIVRGHLVGSIRGLRVTLQAQSHVEGDIFHQSLAIEQSAYFEGKSRRSDTPLAEIKAPGTKGSASVGLRSAESSSSVGSSSILPPPAAE